MSRSVKASLTALGLGPTQRGEIDRNRSVRSSPVMPALDRYTGVLYDGIDVATLAPAARAFADEHVVVHSALFGLIRGDDRIPAYRLSHDSRLPETTLRAIWRMPISAELAGDSRLLLDLRSESYASLGPAPATAWRIRVVAEDASGRRLALSHFNKAAKGEFVRAFVEAGVDHDTVDSLVDWAVARGIRLEPGSDGVLDLVT